MTFCLVRYTTQFLKQKKEQSNYLDCSFYKKAATYSPTCVVPSALKGLTALFGMVRGETFDYNHLKSFRLYHINHSPYILTYEDKKQIFN